MEKQLKALLGAKPAVCNYQKHVKTLSPKEREVFLKDTFALAFSDWRDWEPAYRSFMVCLIESERQRFIDFVRNDTVLGEFLYNLKDKELFERILNLLEQPCRKHKTSYTDLSFSVLLAFDINLKVKTLSDKIRYSPADVDDLFELYEKVAIQ